MRFDGEIVRIILHRITVVVAECMSQRFSVFRQFFALNVLGSVTSLAFGVAYGLFLRVALHAKISFRRIGSRVGKMN